MKSLYEILKHTTGKIPISDEQVELFRRAYAGEELPRAGACGRIWGAFADGDLLCPACQKPVRDHLSVPLRLIVRRMSNG